MTNEVHLIDNLTFMAGLPDKCFDLCLTDPPYNVGIKYDKHNDENKNYEAWCNLWFSEVLRVSHTVVLTGGYKNLKYWVNKNPKGIIYWIKPNQNSPSQLGGFNCVEHVFYFGKLQKRIGQDYFIKSIGMQADASFHPVPKYLPAWKQLLLLVSKPGSIVFDPFIGSGTTRLCCYDLGLDCVGCEKSEFYFNEQEDRFKNHIAQGNLFDVKEIQDNIFEGDIL